MKILLSTSVIEELISTRLKRKFIHTILVLASLSAFSFYKDKDDRYRGFILKDFEKSLALVPKGNFKNVILHDSMTFLDYLEFDSLPTYVDTFYMYNHEVSNGEYLEFLGELEKKDPIAAQHMMPDTLVWRSHLQYQEPYVDYYLRHPAYSNYPVVGISYEQAEHFCKWLTEKYMKEEKRKFKKVRFRLPTLGQWTYAALNGRTTSFFPWNGPSMQNSEGKWLANFRQVYQQHLKRKAAGMKDPDGNYHDVEYYVAVGSISTATDTAAVLEFRRNIGMPVSNAADITSPVRSFYPNFYGIYNMAGNVEEYVREKGIAKGGSWNDTGYYLQNYVQETYDSTNYVSSERGFRFVMELIK